MVAAGEKKTCKNGKNDDWRVRSASLPQIAAGFNAGPSTRVRVWIIQRNIDMSFWSRRSSRLPILTARHKFLRLIWVRQHRHWTAEDWKHVAWSDESLSNSIERMDVNGYGENLMNPRTLNISWESSSWCRYLWSILTYFLTFNLPGFPFILIFKFSKVLSECYRHCCQISLYLKSIWFM